MSRMACLVVLTLALPRLVLADTQLQVHPLQAGEPAPFTGLLFPPASAMHLAQAAEGCALRADAAAKKAAQTLDLAQQESQACATQRAEQTALARRCDVMLSQSTEALGQERAHLSAWVWGPVGMVLGVGMGLLLAAPWEK